MDTSGHVAARGLRPLAEGSDYYGTAPSLFRAVMARWGGMPAQFTFIDLGCGKGRVLLLASEMPFRRCIGVELDPELAATARTNVARWPRATCAIEVLCADAATFLFPAEGACLVYLFHPFSAGVLVRVLENLEGSFAGRPGELELLYVNAELDELFAARPGWRLLWQMPVEMSWEDRAADLLYAASADGTPAFSGVYSSAWRWDGVDPVH